MEATVYILRCADGSYYTGLTKQDIEGRVWEHNNRAAGEKLHVQTAAGGVGVYAKPMIGCWTPLRVKSRLRVGRGARKKN